MNFPPPNQFLRTLFSRSNGLLSHCGGSSSIVILAPVSSSLNALDRDTGVTFHDNLTEEFMQSHILRLSHGKDEVIERARARVYTTINGKTMVIKEDVVFPHRGFKGVKEVRILHDTLFWPDDPNANPYLVYFIDKPLVGTPVPPISLHSHLTEGRQEIKTWEELILRYKQIGTTMSPVFAKLYREFSDALQEEEEQSIPSTNIEASLRSRNGSVTHRSRGHSISSIAPAPLSRANTNQSFSNSPELQFLRIRVDLVLTSAVQAFQCLPQTLLHAIGTESSLDGPKIEKLIEQHILLNLYDVIFYRIVVITESRDEDLAAAIEVSKYADLTQLGSSSTLDLRERHSRAIAALQGVGQKHEPRQKMAALMNTINLLMQHSEKSSDDLIPCLVSVLLKARVSNLNANILYIREFSFENVDGGEHGFALSTLEAVIYHITSSVDSLSATSQRNQEFFAAIQKGDLDQVSASVTAFPEFLEIRDLNNLTPQRLAGPSILAFLLTKACSPSNMSDLLLPNICQESFEDILSLILSFEDKDSWRLLNQYDGTGQSLAHKIHECPNVLGRIYDLLDWQKKDHQGNTPLQVMCRIYDHPAYEELLENMLRTLVVGPDSPDSTDSQDSFVRARGRQCVRLEDHIDAKGNTLAHIVSTSPAMLTILTYCRGNFNARNEKGLTPLLTTIKFARSSTLELLLDRREIDPYARDSRGHSAIHYAARASLTLFNMCVRSGLDINDRATGSNFTPLHIASREGNVPVLKRLLELQAEDSWDWRGFRAGDIVKNDQVRNLMDQWSCQGREVRVLRGHVGEDCSVKYLVKSKSGGGVLRGVVEFAQLRHWLVIRYPASGIPVLQLNFPEPCAIHSRPSRASLMATTERLDAFVQSLLEDESLNQNQIIWEFLLAPTINEVTITRSIESQVMQDKERIWNEEKALASYDSTQIFFAHAREQIMQLSSTYKILERKTRAAKDGQLHLSVAYGLIGKALLEFSELNETSFVHALVEFGESLVPREPSLMYRLIEDIRTLDSRISGLLQSLTIPEAIIERINFCTSEIERHEKDLSKTPRIQFSMLLESQQRKKAVIKHELQGLHTDLKHAGSELRYNETVLAGNLSSFYALHERNAKEAIKGFCSKQLGMERERLVCMQRALKGIRSEGHGM